MLYTPRAYYKQQRQMIDSNLATRVSYLDSAIGSGSLEIIGALFSAGRALKSSNNILAILLGRAEIAIVRGVSDGCKSLVNIKMRISDELVQYIFISQLNGSSKYFVIIVAQQSVGQREKRRGRLVASFQISFV